MSIHVALKKRSEMWGSIAGVLFFGLRGVIDFLSLNELDTGKVESTNVWSPVAKLYEAYGLPYAIFPHVFLVLIFIIPFFKLTLLYVREKRELGSEGLEQLKVHDREMYERRHIAGKQLSPFKRFMALIAAGVFVSAVIFGGIVVLAKMQ